MHLFAHVIFCFGKSFFNLENLMLTLISQVQNLLLRFIIGLSKRTFYFLHELLLDLLLDFFNLLDNPLLSFVYHFRDIFGYLFLKFDTYLLLL